MKVTGIIVHRSDGSYLVVLESGAVGPTRSQRVTLPLEDSLGTPVNDLLELSWVSFEEDDGTTLIEAADGEAVEEVRLRFRSKGGVATLETDPGGHNIDIDGLLGDFAAEAQRISNDPRAQLLRIGDRYTWKDPDYLDGFAHQLEERAAQADAAERRRRLSELQSYATSPEHFVYPFNFVPFPSDDSCVRSLPQGHHQLATGNYSGTLTLRLSAESPLLLRSHQRPDDKWVALRRGRRAVIPGSSLKGAIRSIHETLAGGCLRVFDADYTPAYRDQAATRPAPWTLGVVRATDGLIRPTEVQLCDLVVWVRSDIVLAGLGVPATGDTCDVTPDSWEWTEHHGRFQVVTPNTVHPGRDWVILISPSGARSRKHPYYVAIGRLVDEHLAVTPEAYSTYQKAAANAEDVIVSHRGDMSKLLVEFNGVRVGTRQPVETILPAGTVLWVKPEGGTITEVSRSVIWRSLGSGSARERVPVGYLPCSHTEELCPSCQIFGSADDTTSRQQEEHRSSHNYRSHIRIGDAISTTELPDPGFVDLAAASSPRPGSGQLYLRNNGSRAANNNREVPTYQWGSAADRPRLRRLNGRKYYWPAHSATGKVQRHLRYPDQSAKMTSSVELIAPGTVFEVPIHFDNLTPTQLGGLIAACEPETCLGPERESTVGFTGAGGGERHALTIRVGGGKPLGLGIMTPTIATLDIHTARSRYRRSATDPGSSLSSVDRAELVSAFRAGTHDDVVATWPALAALLDPGFVNPDRVAYPPGDDWEAMERSDHPNPWKPNLDFFRRTSGTYPNGFIPLPEATDPNQYLPRVPPRPGDEV